MEKKKLTFKKFRSVIPKGTIQDDESHHPWGAILYFERGTKTYEEHQPDIGELSWYMQDFSDVEN